MADLTNDQITAGAAVLCDHGQPIGRNAAIAVFDAMRAASPQVADIAELPSIDSAEFRQNLRTYHDEASYGSLRVADNNIIAYIDGKFRDAIAASRCAAGGEVLDAARYRWLRENNIVANVRFHFASGESPYLYAEALDEAIDHNMGYDPLATPAPASAGQAAPTAAVRSAERVDAMHKGVVGVFAAIKAEHLAAQPAEDAGQAGQVAKLADALNTMLWLYRRLPGAYGKPPFVDAALIDLAAIAGVGGVPEAIKERATLLDATHQPSAQVKP